MSEGGKARHPAGEPGSKSREDFDKLVSRAAEARAHGESHVSLSEGAAEVEAAVKAEAERLGYRPGEFIDDHMAIARAALDAVRCAQGRDTDAALAQVQSAQARAARSPQGDPTVSWQQWNDEVNTRIGVQIELADARAEIKRLGELLDGETT